MECCVFDPTGSQREIKDVSEKVVALERASNLNRRFKIIWSFVFNTVAIK